MQKEISFFNTYVSPNAAQGVTELLNSTFLSEGKITEQFEKELCKMFDFKNIITLNSGTSALHLALDLLNIKESDEIIIPAQTFIATGLAVLYCKAKPVFADINYEDGNLNIESVRSKITSKTKAIICVHWGGYPCNMNGLKDLVKNTNIKIIEDAAHALGSVYSKENIGNISDITCFSFQAIKHLTTGDGGAITVKDPELYEKALRKKWFGIDRKNSAVSELGEREYDLKEMGYKYHLNNYASALGIANLSGYAARLKNRREIADYYKQELKNITALQLFKEEPDNKSAYWLFGLHTNNRPELIRKLKAKKVPTSVVHQRIDKNSIFGGADLSLINQTKFDNTQLHIPIHDAIDMETANYIVDAIKSSV
ncbi:MAG: DegT/DnrJ/EryC1/StrS family aminotransferase [Bacteroidetes bacterium]|nr:DegT/DnrJ/EryC1/StrS family aminotransferase [Bacteroidota bacterium]